MFGEGKSFLSFFDLNFNHFLFVPMIYLDNKCVIIIIVNQSGFIILEGFTLISGAIMN